MKKREIWLSLICLTLLCAGVRSALAVSSGEWEYEFLPQQEQGEGVYITYYHPLSTATEAVVPETLGGYPVRGITPYLFSDKDQITSIRLPANLRMVVDWSGNPFDVEYLRVPDTLQHLEVAEGNPVFHARDDALCQGNKLFLAAPASPCEEVHVPEGVTALRGGVFKKSEHLKRLYLPASLTDVEAVSEGTSLYPPVFPDTLEAFIVAEGNPVFQSEDGLLYRGNALAFCPMSKAADLLTLREDTEEIEPFAFYCCNLIHAIRLPSSLREIQSYAFWACRKLESIEGLSGVSRIHEGAFHYCWSLRSISWDEDSEVYQLVNGMLIDRNTQTLLTVIDPTGAQLITVPDGIRRIGEGAMTCLGYMERVQLPDSVTEIGESAFSLTDLTEITLPPQVSRLEQQTFEYCRQLEKVVLPAALEIIGDYAFNDCASLTSIEIPQAVTAIGKLAFSGCFALTQITLPEGLTALGTQCFDHCSALRTITVPGGVKEPGEYCFWACTALETAVFREGAEILKENIFDNCSALRYLYLPKSLTRIESWGDYFPDSPNLTAVVWPGSKAEAIFDKIGKSFLYPTEGRWKATDPGTAAALGLTDAEDIHLVLTKKSFTLEYSVNGETRQETYPCRWEDSTLYLEEGYLHYTLEEDCLMLEMPGGVLRLEREGDPYEDQEA